MEFEWDDAKSASNFLKHGISFYEATRVFSDPLVQVSEVTKPEHGETRFKAVGQIDDGIFAVIYTDRRQTRRVISARKSRRNERRIYHGQGIAPR
ncbi:MAG: BrnT family toxin [Chloroflexia bacterium]|nr:BrnT family toxin [Chloroflexia bacterium]